MTTGPVPAAGRARGGMRALALATIVAGSATGAQAQSLAELLEAAQGYDATYLAARALYESAPYRVEQARALNRPNVSAAADIGQARTDPVAGERFRGRSVGASIGGRQPLYNRANDATIAQQERTLVSSLADLDTAGQDLTLRLSQAYFDVLAAQDTLATTRANKAAISEQLASARSNFEVGTATITDTREAQARFDLATSQEIAANNDLVIRRIALDQLVGRSDVTPRGLALPIVLPLPAESVDAFVSRAAVEHPAVRRSLVAYENARLETEKARAQGLPTVDAVAEVSAGRNTIASNVTGNRAGASIGLRINVPLYTGRAVQNRISETLLLEERSRNDLDATRRLVTQQTRQAYYSLRSVAAQVTALEAAEASSQLALEATRLGYRVGVRVNVDVLNAQSQLFQTQAQLARSRYDVLLGNLRLRQAAGTLTPSDVINTDRFLSR